MAVTFFLHGKVLPISVGFVALTTLVIHSMWFEVLFHISVGLVSVAASGFLVSCC